MVKATISELHTHLGYQLRAVSNAVSHSFARKLDNERVTVAEWVFLRVLYDFEALPPSELAARMGMTKGAISKLADRLVEKNLLDRQFVQDGAWRQTLSLKPSGRALVPRLAQLADQNDAEFFGVLTPDERRQLEQLLSKVAHSQNLTNVPTD